MAAADPPGDPSSQQINNEYDDRLDDDEFDRPLICSNPSSYASISRSNSSATGTTTSTSYHQHQHPLLHQQQQQRGSSRRPTPNDRLPPRADSTMDEDPSLRRSNTSSSESQLPFRRTFTAHAAYFDEHYADPVESVAGGSAALMMYPPALSPHPGRREVSGGEISLTDEPGMPRRQPSREQQPGYQSSCLPSGHHHQKSSGAYPSSSLTPPPSMPYRQASYDANESERDVRHNLQRHQLNKAISLDHGSGGTTEGLTDDQSDDEDICQENYRRLPPPRVAPPPRVSPTVVPSTQKAVQEQQQIVRRGLEPEEYTGESSEGGTPKQEIVPYEHRVRDPSRERPRDRSRARSRGGRSRSRGRYSSDIVRFNILERQVQNQLTLAVADDDNSPPIYNDAQLFIDGSAKYNGYQHCFITIKEQHRFLMLYTFLKRHVHSKIIIFFSTTKSVQYFSRLLIRLKFNVHAIHSGMNRERFLEKFFEFSKEQNDKGGILCIPDFQGNDIAIPPTTSWIIQFEPCCDPSDYIFRVGRISAENSKRGGSPPRALLFLTPCQFGFLKYYKAAKVKVYEYEIPKVASVQKELMKLVKRDDKLRKFGVEAYHAYLMAYASHEYRDIYNVHDLDVRNVALCFGFEKPPPSKMLEEEEEREAEKKDKVSDLQEARNNRERNRWKPVKNEKTNCWMTGEKSWRYSNVHSDKMRKSGQKDGAKTNPDDYKPKTIKMRH